MVNWKRLTNVFLIFSIFICLFGITDISEAHILVVGDSKSDFSQCYTETHNLANKLKEKGYHVLELYRSGATTENILKGMYNADAVIYAGHGGYQSGHYDGQGGVMTPPLALVGTNDFIWGIGSKMREGFNGILFKAPFKPGIPVFLLHACFSTGWEEDDEVANPIETIYNFARMFNGVGANYYATGYDAEIIYDFLNGATNFYSANQQNYEKIATSTTYNGVKIWRNTGGYTAFVGNWNGKFPTASQTTPYDGAAADAWYHGDRVMHVLYVNSNIGNDAWDGTYPTSLGGTTGPIKTINKALSVVSSGWTIMLAPGTYKEALNINKKVNLLGTGANTIITSPNALTPAITIKSGASGSSIKNLNVNGVKSSSGIYLSGASYCVISKNSFSGNSEAVSIDGGSNNYVDGNVIKNGNNGVTAKNTKTLVVKNNKIEKNTKTGVNLTNSTSGRVARNNITGNKVGVSLSSNSQKNTIEGNRIIGNTQTGVSLERSSNNNIKNGNVIIGNTNGVTLRSSSNKNNITGNTIFAKNLLISVSGSTGNLITGNKLYFTNDQVSIAASNVKNYIEVYHALPAKVNVAGTSLGIYTFYYMLTAAVQNLHTKNPSMIKALSYRSPQIYRDNIRVGGVSKSEYLHIADVTKVYMDKTGIVPGYAYQTSVGAYFGYKSLIYMYSKILDNYHKTKTLPATVGVKPWRILSDPNAVAATNSQIITAAINIKTYLETYHQLPNKVSVSGKKVSIYTFYYLLSTVVQNLYNKNNNPVFAHSFKPPQIYRDNIRVGGVSKSEYLHIADVTKVYMDKTGIVPGYAYQTSVGAYFGYKSLIYMHCKILKSYNTSKILPSTIGVKPWSQI